MKTLIKNKLSRTPWVVRLVRFAERNHLTSRTSTDIYYGTRPTLTVENEITCCFDVNHRVLKRPNNMFRKFFFDLKKACDQDRTTLEGFSEVRSSFRYIDASEFRAAAKAARAAPGNNHKGSCALRNAGSNILSAFKTKLKSSKSDRNWKIFSISGAKAEINACDGGFRGEYQPTDFAQPSRLDKNLKCHPLLSKNPTDENWIAISTDTINHLSELQKSAILGNGVPIISYSTMPFTGTALRNLRTTEKISRWDSDGALITAVNGGGDYRDVIWDIAADTEYVINAAGDMVLCYIETTQDPSDDTHCLLAEIPYCVVKRNSPAFFMLLNSTQPLRRIRPLRIQGLTGNYDVFRCRHSDLYFIQHEHESRIVAYTSREIHECISRCVVANKIETRLINACLKFNPPEGFGIEKVDRAGFLVGVGVEALKLLNTCPVINLPMPPSRDLAKAMRKLALHDDDTQDTGYLRKLDLPTLRRLHCVVTDHKPVSVEPHDLEVWSSQLNAIIREIELKESKEPFFDT